MIHAWLDLPMSGILAALAALYGMAALLLLWLTARSPLAPAIKAGIVVAPYFGAIVLLFALLTGFLAADIGDRNRQATRAVQAEGEALTSLYTLSVASAPDMSDIRARVRAYARSVLDDEWTLISSGKGSPKTATLLAGLMQSVARPDIATTASNAVHNSLMTLTLRVAGARSDRLSLGGDRSYELKWMTVLFLCFMTQVSLALVHADRTRAQAIALGVFTVAAVVALGFIAEQESPFDGVLQVARWPYEQILNLPGAPENPNG